MKNCRNCGAELQDGQTFCHVCGTPAGEGGNGQQPNYQNGQPNYQGGQQSNYQNAQSNYQNAQSNYQNGQSNYQGGPQQNYQNTQQRYQGGPQQNYQNGPQGYQNAQQNSYGQPIDQAFVPNPADVADNKAMGILAYIGILVLIPIFAAKNSPFSRFHANEGLILLIVEIISSILGRIFAGFLPVTIILSLLNVALLVYSILGIINAAQGTTKYLPLLKGIHILN